VSSLVGFVSSVSSVSRWVAIYIYKSGTNICIYIYIAERTKGRYLVT
jgi:hypothetical protein